MSWHHCVLIFGLTAAAAEQGCASPTSSASSALLQRTRKAALKVATPRFHYDAKQMWNLDSENALWKQTFNTSSNRCRLRIQNASGVEEESELSIGSCLRAWKPAQKFRLDLALPASGNRTSPGKNPSLLPLPAKLASSFPDGKWLAVGRAGWMRCPGMEDYPMGDLRYMRNTYCT
ncbi:unnamed protein product, partial [Symbiodinium pilosum]